MRAGFAFEIYSFYDGVVPIRMQESFLTGKIKSKKLQTSCSYNEVV